MVLERQDYWETVRMEIKIHFDHFNNVSKADLARHCMPTCGEDVQTSMTVSKQGQTHSCTGII